jgi:hypothetical protein
MATSTGFCLKAQSAMLYTNEMNGESRLCLGGVNIMSSRPGKFGAP